MLSFHAAETANTARVTGFANRTRAAIALL